MTDGLYPLLFDKKTPPVKFKKLREGAPQLPSRGTPVAAGLDLRADLTGGVKVFGADAKYNDETDEWLATETSREVPVVSVAFALQPGQRAFVPCGYGIALAPGHEGQVRPRSGLALKKGLTVLNSPGTIDEDYRGEVGVILVNQGLGEVLIEHGERIAQLVIAPVVYPEAVLVDELDETDRGSNGFGSTGVR